MRIIAVFALALAACGGAAVPSRPCGGAEQRCCGYLDRQYIPADAPGAPWCESELSCLPTYDGAGNPAPATCL